MIGRPYRHQANPSKPTTHTAANFERDDKNKDSSLSWEEFVGHDRWKREPKAN
jgi:hypothetical protein